MDQKFQSLIEKINELIIINSRSKDNFINMAIDDLIQGGGKRLRPILTILSAKFSQINKEKIYTIAAGLELIHMATLIHDDIIDDAKLRRSNLSCQSKFGKDIAVFIGDFLLSQSFYIFSQHLSRKSMFKLSKVLKLICEGEVSQYRQKYNFELTFFDYLRRIRQKTALLFGLCTYIGAYESGVVGRQLSNLYNLGLNLGMSFQIQDDILDFIGEKEEVGKAVAKDISEGIITLPVIYLLQDKDYASKGKEILAKDKLNLNELKEFIELIKTGGFLEKSQQLGERYIVKAKKHLSLLTDNKVKEDFKIILDWQLERHY